uniref:Uncharacterized protein n=1 Tax=Anguilla anguilla TaxID=7936 RepID=A0A0E9WQS4_ANGAN
MAQQKQDAFSYFPPFFVGLLECQVVHTFKKTLKTIYIFTVPLKKQTTKKLHYTYAFLKQNDCLCKST